MSIINLFIKLHGHTNANVVFGRSGCSVMVASMAPPREVRVGPPRPVGYTIVKGRSGAMEQLSLLLTATNYASGGYIGPRQRRCFSHKMIVTVEGNIGAGKTSFAKSLFDAMKRIRQNVVYIPEPVDSWTNFQGVNLLDLMYKDAERWLFTFQVNALLHMIRLDKEALDFSNKGYTVIKERSSFTTRRIFIEIAKGRLQPQEKNILEELCKSIEDPFKEKTCCSSCRAEDITLYLRTDPPICLERVQKRGRREEIYGGVNLCHLLKLHFLHEIELPKTHGRLVVADGNSFNVDDPRTVRLFGCDCCIINTINGMPCNHRPIIGVDKKSATL